MHSTEQLKRLLSKYFQGRINQAEALELLKLINDQDLNESMIAWLYTNWNETNPNDSDFHNDTLYNTIRRELNLPENPSPQEKEIVNHLLHLKNHPGRKRITIMVKYAAIFIFALISAYGILQFTDINQITGDEKYSEVITDYGSKSTISLPDGSTVKLNSGSYLRYPEHFHGKNRNVFLRGEGFFNVKHSSKKPFFVNTDANIAIKVTGTTFNVKSFPEDNLLETTLISGQIIIKRLDAEKRIKQQALMRPNQIAVYNKITRHLSISDLRSEKEIVEPVSSGNRAAESVIPEDARILTAWKDDKLVFRNESFDQLAISLERWYNVEISFRDESLKEFRFTGTFENETLEQALEALKLASSFNYSIDKNRITISK